MGGVAGHLAHLHDNRELTYNKIAKILNLANQGKLKGTEKTDGFNIYLGFKDGSARYARNTGDMRKGGGVTADLLAREFAGGENVKKVYLDAFKSYEKAIKSLNPDEIVKIFGKNGEIFYNSEIQGPGASNVVNYDKNIISIHHLGHKMFSPEENKVLGVDAPSSSKFLDSVIDRFEQETAAEPFDVKRTAILKLEALDGDEDMNIALEKIKKAGLKGSMTIGDLLENEIAKIVHSQVPHMTDQTKQDIVWRILQKEGHNSVTQIYKGFPKDQKELVRSLIKQGPQFISDIVYPIEDAIHDYAVVLLQGLESAYILDNHAELRRLQKEVANAIEEIRKYEGPGKEEAHSLLKKQLGKIKHHDNINTTVEGFVFEHEGQMYKFTGNFAPINQLLGLFRYGRGTIPSIQRAEEQPERLQEDEDFERQETGDYSDVERLALVPGGFKPPHRGHLSMVAHFADLADKVLILIGEKARELPNGKEVTLDTALRIWEIYLKDSQLENVEIVVVESNPTKTAYHILGDALPGQTVIMGCGAKDEERFSSGMSQYAPEGVDIETSPCPNLVHTVTGETLSASFMREYIANNDFEEFSEYIPDSSKYRAEELFSLLGGERRLQESVPDAIFRLVEEAMKEAEDKTLLLEQRLNEIFLIEDKDMLYEEFEKFILEEGVGSVLSTVKGWYGQAKNKTKDWIAARVQQVIGLLERATQKFIEELELLCIVLSPGSGQCAPAVKSKLDTLSHKMETISVVLQRSGGKTGRARRHIILIVGALASAITITVANKLGADEAAILQLSNLVAMTAEALEASDPATLAQTTKELMSAAAEHADKVELSIAGLVGAKGTKGVVDVAAAGTKLGKYRAVQEKKKKVKNKYAICTVSIGKTAGTQERSEWSDAEMKRYERCKAELDEVSAVGQGAVEMGGGKKKKRKSIIREKELQEMVEEVYNVLTNFATN